MDLDHVTCLVPEEWDFLWFVQKPGMFHVEYDLDLDQKHDLDLDQKHDLDLDLL